jgi:hypothetical protein
MTLPEPQRRALQRQQEIDREVIRLMQDALRDIDVHLRVLERKSGVGVAVRRSQIAAARAAILRGLTNSWARLGNVIETQAAATALAAAEANAKYDKAFLDALGLSPAEQKEFNESMRQSAKSSVRNAMNRAVSPGARQALSERVYGSRALASGFVDRRINSAIARGLSAKEFAAEMRGIINPRTPGGVSYAAKRLARTEINNAFHITQINDVRGKPWVNGLRWSLSGSHPKPDQCDALARGHSQGLGAGVYRPDDVPNKPHPQCLCFLEPVTMSPAEFERRLSRGEFDNWQAQNLPR